MNARLTFSMALTAGLIGALIAAPQAMAATVSNHSGTICKNYNAWEANYMDYLVSGARSRKTGDTWVICPLVRRTQSANGATAYVNGTHAWGGATWCGLYSFTDNGNSLGGVGTQWYGTGPYEFTLYLGAGRSNAWSDYAVLCRIPGSTNGLIMGIDLVEY